MTPEQFAYWLQGFSEMSPSVRPTPEQWEMIKEHLATVFTKVTPPLKKQPALEPFVFPDDLNIKPSPFELTPDEKDRWTQPGWPHGPTIIC